MAVTVPAEGQWRRPGRLRRRVGDGWRHAVALPIAALFLLPLAWLVATSLREGGRPPARRLEWVPDPISWANYPAVFDALPILTFAANSLLVAGIAVPVTVLVASWAGFAMAQLPGLWRWRLAALSFAALMVPVTAVWVPRFALFRAAGLVDTPWALIAPAAMGTSPTFALLFLWTFLRVPPAIYEAARLDGAGALRLWAGIAMPLARPTAVAVAVLAFGDYWSNFVDPLLYIQSTEKQTLPLALRALNELGRTDWPKLMAGVTLLTLPLVGVFLVAQRAYLRQVRDER